MPFQRDQFGHEAYRYTPDETKEKLVERCPDKLPSSAQAWFEAHGHDVRYFLQVRGVGVLMMRCSTGHIDGKIKFEGVSLVTDAQIMFD